VIHANDSPGTCPEISSDTTATLPLKNSSPGQLRRITGDWRSCAVGWLADQTTVGKGEALRGTRFDAIATELDGFCVYDHDIWRAEQ
jgi:hypothetical protein